MDDKVQKDNLTDLASSLATQSDNSQSQQSDDSQPTTDTNNNQQDQQPTQNLADNQVVGSNGEVIDLGRTSEESINK